MSDPDTNARAKKILQDAGLEAVYFPPPGQPGPVADKLLAEFLGGDWLYYGGEAYFREETHWRIEPWHLLEARVNGILNDVMYEGFNTQGKPRIKQWNPNTARLRDVMNQLKFKMIGRWVSLGLPDPNPAGWAFFRNGRVCADGGGLIPHDGEMFNTYCTPCDYDPEEGSPLLDKLLVDSFGADEDRIETHLRFMAMDVFGRIDLQKFYVLVGPGGSGKSTLMTVLNALYGPGATAPVSMRDMGSEFGLANCIGKKAIRISDDRSNRISTQATENFLKVIGGDEMQINIKSRDMWNGRLRATLSIVSNQLPPFVDASRAIKRRLIFNKTGPGSAEGHEDWALADRIINSELAGVFNRVLDAAGRLDDEWPVPEYVQDDLVEMDHVANPVLDWLQEMLDTGEYMVGKDRYVTAKSSYARYIQWCQENGHDDGMNSIKFGHGVKAAVTRVQPAVGGYTGRVQQRMGGLKLWIRIGFGDGVIGDWRENVPDVGSGVPDVRVV